MLMSLGGLILIIASAAIIIEVLSDGFGAIYFGIDTSEKSFSVSSQAFCRGAFLLGIGVAFVGYSISPSSTQEE